LACAAVCFLGGAVSAARQGTPAPNGGNPPAMRPDAPRAGTAAPYLTLLLAQAQFGQQAGPDGREQLVPAPAKLLILQQRGGSWHSTAIEDRDSNVIHKAAPFGADGILTIGASEARLKLWRKRGRSWEGETLWNPTFGGRWDRLRDFEVGDVDGDREGGAWRATEVYREAGAFVHEVELGDVNGDGMSEIYATPSAANKLGRSQSGSIVQVRFAGGRYRHAFVLRLHDRHAKEILVADVDGDGRADLLAALEAVLETVAGQTRVKVPVEIRRLRPTGNGTFAAESLLELDGRQCRVLIADDLDQDGRIDLLATTMKAGVFALFGQGRGRFAARAIDPRSTGFENAACVVPGPAGRPREIIIAADDQDEIVRLRPVAGGYVREVIARTEPRDLTWYVHAYFTNQEF
jgi:hypothetical protein